MFLIPKIDAICMCICGCSRKEGSSPQRTCKYRNGSGCLQKFFFLSNITEYRSQWISSHPFIPPNLLKTAWDSWAISISDPEIQESPNQTQTTLPVRALTQTWFTPHLFFVPSSFAGSEQTSRREQIYVHECDFCPSTFLSPCPLTGLQFVLKQSWIDLQLVI